LSTGWLETSRMMRVLTCWKISKLCSDLQKLLKRQRWSYHPWPKQILGQFPQLSLNVASFLFSIFSNILFVLLSVCLLLQLLQMVPSILRQLLPGLNLRSCAQISLTGLYSGSCYGLDQNLDVHSSCWGLDQNSYNMCVVLAMAWVKTQMCIVVLKIKIAWFWCFYYTVLDMTLLNQRTKCG